MIYLKKMVQLFVNHLNVKSFIYLLSLVTFVTKICELATKFLYLVTKKQLDFFIMSPEHVFFESTPGLIVLSATHRTAIHKGLIECLDYLSVWIKYMTSLYSLLSFKAELLIYP